MLLLLKVDLKAMNADEQLVIKKLGTNQLDLGELIATTIFSSAG